MSDSLMWQNVCAISFHRYLQRVNLGWVLFPGSVAVLAGFLVALAILSLVNMPLEERALEARFGETYLDYKRRVPRWLGRMRSRTH